jgi:hypothetical protein
VPGAVPSPLAPRRWGSRQAARAFALLAAVSLALAPVAAAAPDAATASIAISSVDGQGVRNGKVAKPVSGTVPVTGTASPSGSGTDEKPAALVADAGDSSFTQVGDQAPLLGAGFGGQEPYTFAWTSEKGEILGADAPTAALDTTGLAAGRHRVQLAVTDASGATARDDVVVVVYQESRSTLLEETRQDPTPGITGTGQYLLFPFDVPEGVSQMTVDLSWTVLANDYDLQVLDPSGAVKASSGKAAGQPEQVGIPSPVPGRWTVRAEKWATIADSVTARVTAVSSGADPRPRVSSGGPYTFTLDDTQQLSASVTGGEAPVTTAWDLGGDGTYEAKGAEVTAQLAEGRHLVTVKATDAGGLERRETTSVLVATPERLAADTTPVTVIGVADTGINPYHLEFSAQTYPDPDVLALTEGFTRHPSEYIPGYPKDAQALEVTLGAGYFPAADKPIWSGNDTVKPGNMYWIPGTKIIGAVDAGGSTGVTSGSDPHPILDDNGHGSGSASVSAGNRYGYCPTCLLVVVEALDETVVAALPWVDISTNSFGYIGGLPIGLLTGGSEETKAAAERGQTTLFAAGNGVGNAFDVPISTYGSDQTGPDWNVTVGALRRDNQRAVVGDGIPVHLSSWGDGNLPSACRSGTVGQCAFGGTSAATPYTAGAFGTVLTEVRRAVGDGQAGQKAGQVVADGLALEESVYLADGRLTRAELREAVLKTAQPLNQDNAVSPYPYPLTAPYTDANVLVEGYGAATPEGAQRAIDVLLGRSQLPERPFEDAFFALDRQVRDTVYGGYDRDGDGKTDSEAVAGGLGLTLAGVSDASAAVKALQKAASLSAPAPQAVTGQNAIAYHLHRTYAGHPDEKPACSTTSNEQSMSRSDTTGDLEPCFESRVTSVVAAFRPLGIFASSDVLDAPVPAGSTISVDLFVAGETPSAIRPTGVLMATDREVGRGEGAVGAVLGSGPAGAGCGALGEACWTRFTLSFETTRHAFTGEQLTFQVGLLGARSWAFGFEGAHASKVSIAPAAVPAAGFEFGATVTEPADGSAVPAGQPLVAGGSFAFPNQGSDPTGAGDHPVTRRVEVSVDDPAYGGTVIEATLDEESGTWSAPLGALGEGEHTVYARARVDQRVSEAASSTFTVRPATQVQWQVVDRNGPADPARWADAAGVATWSFSLDTADHGSGQRMILARLVENGAETVRTGVQARFR